MRLRAAAALAAATILLLPATSIATGNGHRPTRRTSSHISLHLSRHNLLSGRTLVASGRFAPGGRTG